MNKQQLQRVRGSFEWFRPCGPAMMARVLRGLGDHYPGVRALFPDDCAELNTKFFRVLTKVVRALPAFHTLEEPLMKLGRDAYRHGASVAHYRIIRNEVLAAMAELAGDGWSEELHADWTLLLEAVSGAMLRGVAQENNAEAA